MLEERHVGRAAERLNLTPSAVSHGLKRLRALLNDPLFLRTPKGVAPTARALTLAAPIAEILSGTAAVLDLARPFDAASSTRRFTIGGPDAVLAAFVIPALDAIAAEAPGLDFSLVHILASGRGAPGAQLWADGLKSLDARRVDLAILSLDAAPPRYAVRPLYDESFVVAARRGHGFAAEPTLDAFCDAAHILVSTTGDAYGFVDEWLEGAGRRRRIALTVPGFMMALAQVANSDRLAVLPRGLVERHADALGLVTVALPLPRPPDSMAAVTVRAALMDAGIAWLVEALARAAGRDNGENRPNFSPD